MSKPRYRWWGHAKNILRDYPRLRREYLLLKSQSITPAYETAGHGSEISRPVETVALRTLPDADDQRAFDAARQTAIAIQAEDNGELKYKLLEMIYWKGTHTLAGAAQNLYISERTAKRWNRHILITVGRFYGFLPHEEKKDGTSEPKNRDNIVP